MLLWRRLQSQLSDSHSKNRITGGTVLSDACRFVEG